MEIFKHLAHSEDLHNTQTSELEHLLTSWYVALPLYLGLLGLLNLILQKQGVKHNRIILLNLLILLIVGTLFYSTVPVISVVSIALGMGVALLFSLATIMS